MTGALRRVELLYPYPPTSSRASKTSWLPLQLVRSIADVKWVDAREARAETSNVARTPSTKTEAAVGRYSSESLPPYAPSRVPQVPARRSTAAGEASNPIPSTSSNAGLLTQRALLCSQVVPLLMMVEN